MKAFYLLPVPQPGEEVEFLPDRELQPVHYARPRIVDMTERFVHRSPLAVAEAEAADALQCWTVACLCRSLSIDNILAFLTGVLAVLSRSFMGYHYHKLVCILHDASVAPRIKAVRRVRGHPLVLMQDLCGHAHQSWHFPKSAQ